MDVHFAIPTDDALSRLGTGCLMVHAVPVSSGASRRSPECGRWTVCCVAERDRKLVAVVGCCDVDCSRHLLLRKRRSVAAGFRMHEGVSACADSKIMPKRGFSLFCLDGAFPCFAWRRLTLL